MPTADKRNLINTVAIRATDDQVEREKISARVNAYLKDEDFAALNKMATEFLTTRARTPSGVWKLRVFHTSVRSWLKELQPAETCVSAARPILNRWSAFDPSAPAPPITEAWALLEQAWCKRHDVNWGAEPFRADASKADQTLAVYKSVASVDPEYYATAEDVAFVTRSDKADFNRLLAEGIAHEPSYYGLYFSAAKYFLPAAYGSTQDVDRIARLAADKSSGTDGLGAYARVYWLYRDCGCSLWQSAIDWTLMKQSMADVVARYPADWNVVNFAKIACQMGDSREAAKYFSKLRRDNGLAWRNDEERKECRTMAALGEIGGRPAQAKKGR